MAIWGSLPPSAVSSYTLPPNIVLVDSTQPAVAGKIYATWALADAYVQTQIPSATNIWGIKITGNNAENIIIRDWIRIIGERQEARLTGNITSTIIFVGPNAFEPMITNCILTNLTGGLAGGLITLVDCEVAGGIVAANFYTLLINCFVTGGDFTAGVTVAMQGGALAGTFGFLQAEYFKLDGAGITLNGGDFRNCLFNAAILNDANYFIGGGLLDTNFTITAGSYVLDNVAIGSSTITMNGGTLSTYGVSGRLQVSVIGGTWNNHGDKYDNVASGLVATNTQAAIDEVVTMIPGLDWRKYSFDASAMNCPLAFWSDVIFNLQSDEVIEAAIIKHTVAFSGVGLTKCEISMGPFHDEDKYIRKFNVMGTPLEQEYEVSILNLAGRLKFSSEVIKLDGYAVGAIWNNINTGHVDIWVKISKID